MADKTLTPQDAELTTTTTNVSPDVSSGTHSDTHSGTFSNASSGGPSAATTGTTSSYTWATELDSANVGGAASQEASANAEQAPADDETPNELAEGKQTDKEATKSKLATSAENDIEESNTTEASGNGGEDDDTEQKEPPRPMTLTEHFIELRNRLIKIFISVIVGFLVLYYFSEQLADFIYKPLVNVLPNDAENQSKIIFTGVAEGFFTHMKLAFVAGIFLTSPAIFYQIWSFIAPGLYDDEKKYILPVAFCSALFFILGGAFCYYIVFPNAFSFFMTYSKGPFQAMPGMGEYFSFALQLLVAFGLVFELPLFTFFLAKIGLVTAKMMRSFRRYFIVIAFIMAAVLTPPDVISQLLMAAPMLILYELSIFIAGAFGKKEEPVGEDDDEEDDDED